MQERIVSFLRDGRRTAAEIKDALGVDYRVLFSQLSSLASQGKIRVVNIEKYGLNILHYELDFGCFNSFSNYFHQL